MRITRLVIQNFRNFKDLVIDPFPTPAVIVGENGSGKSNLLHALRLVLDPGLPDRARRLRGDDIHEGSTSLADGVEVVVSIDLSDFDDDDSAQVELDGAIIATSPYVARLTYRFSPRTQKEDDKPFTPDDYQWGLFAGDSTTEDVRRIRDHIGLTVLQALRDAESDLARFSRSPLARLLEQLPPEEASLDAAHAAIEEAMDGLRQDDQIQEAERRIRVRSRRMAGPQLPLDPSLGFTTRKNDGLVRSLQLFIDETRTRTVAQTSTGAANVLYLALLLESLTIRREKDAVVDTFLAVEEPEAHLHPVLQRNLFSHLLREPTRLLLTPHSPHIAAVAPLESIVLLTRTRLGSETTASTLNGAGLTARDVEDLERYLNVSRAEVLFSRLIILVEGISEVYCLPAMAKALGFDLDAHGVVVANIEGTNFAPFMLLLGPSGLNREVLVVTDGDAADGKEPGIKRAGSMLGDRVPASDLIQAAEELSAVSLPTDGDMRIGRPRQVERAASAGIFIGNHTLEIDLASAVPDALKRAFSELEERSHMIDQFNTAVDKISSGSGEKQVRDSLLRRVEDDQIGKGRFARSLARQLEHLEPNELIEDPVSSREDSVTQLLRMPAGYLLGVLEDASVRVRGRGLGVDMRANTDSGEEATAR